MYCIDLLHRGGIEEVTRQVEAAGFKLNAAGGQTKVSNVLCCGAAMYCLSIGTCLHHGYWRVLPSHTKLLSLPQVSPDGGLLQSSTMADTHIFRFAGGVHLLTCALAALPDCISQQIHRSIAEPVLGVIPA